MQPSRKDGTARGFTLLEILIALVIFALVFGGVAQIMQIGLRQSAAAQSLATASLLARSELARVGVEVPLQAGRVAGGTGDGMQWQQTEIDLVQGPSAQHSLALYQVQVTVAWGASPAERLMLTTLRTGVPSE